MLILLIAILYVMILGALVVGQARLIGRSVRSGEAVLGRLAKQRATSPIGYWIWIAVYVVFLIYVAAYLVGGLIGFMQETAP